MKIELQGIVKRFKSRRALDDVGLTLEPGQVVALLGLNGAGKTTLLRCLAGTVAPDQGRILYDGQLFLRQRMDLRRQFMFLPDFPTLFEEWSPLQHIGMAAGSTTADSTWFPLKKRTWSGRAADESP
jgi:ABC-2 type transport system ATP-binding protein